MFIELTLPTNPVRKIWVKANTIMVLTIWQNETRISLSGSPEDEGISVIETPDYIMGKIVESARWNR